MSESTGEGRDDLAGTDDTKSGGRGGWLRPLFLLLAIITLLVLGRVLHLDEELSRLDEWIRDLGPWGPVAFVGIYVAATVAALPATVLSVVAGMLFGAWKGTLLISVASTTGASVCFLLSRYFARKSMERWLSGSDLFRRLDSMSVQYGSVVVAVTRLVPLFPYNMLNYGFGLTRIPFTTYLFWSWLCMLPGTFMYVAGGGIFKKIYTGQALEKFEIAALGAAVLLLLVLSGWARRIYKRGKRAGQGDGPDAEEVKDGKEVGHTS